VPAADVLAGRVPGEAVRGKIALVGFTAAGFDENPTPFAPVQPGVELQATVVDNLLYGRALLRPWWIGWAEAGAILLIGLSLGLALRSSHTVAGAALGAGVAIAYLAATQWAFVRDGFAIGGVYPVIAVVLCTLGGSVFRAVTEEREKRQIRSAFRHYLNPEVTDLVARDPSQLRLGGERREITVLFSDVRGFTSISERLDPRALAELLNEYLGAMTDVVFRHAGLLDKYVGDAVMAFWGAPVETPAHARQCCEAALDMLTALATLRERWASLGWPPFDIRIGINTSQAAVGNFGSPQRFSYTAVGDGVNLASRLEGLNKVYGTRILIAESTRQQVGDDFICRQIDVVRVRGRDQPVAVYELLGRRADDVDGTLARRALRFESAIVADREGSRDQAVGTLEALAADSPDDVVVVGYLERWRAGAGAPNAR
jgi:adenylate cyclase